VKRLVFITGGSRGIGARMVKTMHEAGYLVAFTYVSQHLYAEQLVHECGGRPLAICMDQGSVDQIKPALEKARLHFGTSISILINNAAIGDEKPFIKITEADFDRMMAVNLKGPFILCQEVVEDMRRQSWGRIINITSIGGQWGGFNQVHYAATKAGLINLTRSLAKIYSRDGIVSTAVAIGLVKTDMTANELQTLEGQEKVRNIPAGRLATTVEIAATVEYLCSDAAAYLCGQTLNINGGMYFG